MKRKSVLSGGGHGDRIDGTGERISLPFPEDSILLFAYEGAERENTDFFRRRNSF